MHGSAAEQGAERESRNGASDVDGAGDVGGAGDVNGACAVAQGFRVPKRYSSHECFESSFRTKWDSGVVFLPVFPFYTGKR